MVQVVRNQVSQIRFQQRRKQQLATNKLQDYLDAGNPSRNLQLATLKHEILKKNVTFEREPTEKYKIQYSMGDTPRRGKNSKFKIMLE